MGTRKSGRLEGKGPADYNEEKIIVDEAGVKGGKEPEQRMDEGPLTLEELYRSEEGGEAFLDLFQKMVTEREQQGERARAREGGA